jgi:hypothetical protein
MDNVIESLIKTDYKKELNKVSIFERCNNSKNNNKCISCNKYANFVCLIENEHYCWYHTITWKEK